MKAIQRLLEAFEQNSIDSFGYYHYIPKELYDDAKQEFEEWEKAQGEIKRRTRLHTGTS